MLVMLAPSKFCISGMVRLFKIHDKCQDSGAELRAHSAVAWKRLSRIMIFDSESRPKYRQEKPLFRKEWKLDGLSLLQLFISQAQGSMFLFQMICRTDNCQNSQTRLVTNKALQPVASPLPQQAQTQNWRVICSGRVIYWS